MYCSVYIMRAYICIIYAYALLQTLIRLNFHRHGDIGDTTIYTVIIGTHIQASVRLWIQKVVKINILCICVCIAIRICYYFAGVGIRGRRRFTNYIFEIVVERV